MECADGAIGYDAGASMKALPKRKGNVIVISQSPAYLLASMKALPKRKGNVVGC